MIDWARAPGSAQAVAAVWLSAKGPKNDGTTDVLPYDAWAYQLSTSPPLPEPEKAVCSAATVGAVRVSLKVVSRTATGVLPVIPGLVVAAPVTVIAAAEV